ncbi:MAG: DUF58 domain-containing protein [Candidatus Thermoplasmatota archaeon]|nr:DUF58 domain-containing protein [Candidatus Thermoplasmatota archaeon]
MKKSKPFLYLAVLAVVGLILGNLFRSWIFLVGSISSLAFFVIATRSLPPEDLEVEISRESEEKEVYLGDELKIKINVENKGGKVRFLEIYDLLPSIVEIEEGSNHQILELEKYETKEMEYKISFPVTGKVELGPIELKYKDPLSLFSKEWRSEKKMMIQVLPAVEEMQSVDLNPSFTKYWLGNIKSKSIGVGSEFFSLREYHPGDQFRDINWKATARNLSPITNEYEGEKSGDVILVVDGYHEGVVGTPHNNTLKTSINAAATLASNILSNRNRVGLIVLGDYLNWVFPQTGKNQFHRIMGNLTKLESGGSWNLEEVKWLLKDFFPRRSLVIFISPLTVPEFSETIVNLGMDKYDVMVLSPDPLKIEKEIVGKDKELEAHEEISERLYETDRKNLIKRLWRYGVVVDWDPTEPLEPTLEEVLKYQKTARKP